MIFQFIEIQFDFRKNIIFYEVENQQQISEHLKINSNFLENQLRIFKKEENQCCFFQADIGYLVQYLKKYRYLSKKVQVLVLTKSTVYFKVKY